MKRLMTFIAAILLTTVAAMAQHEEGDFTVQPKVGLNIATLSDADKAITDLHFGIEAEYMVTDNFSLGLAPFCRIRVPSTTTMTWITRDTSTRSTWTMCMCPFLPAFMCCQDWP